MRAPGFWDASVGYWEISLGQSLAELSDWLLEAQLSFKWTSSVRARRIPEKEDVWQVKCFYFMMENEQEHQTGKLACQAWEFLTDRLSSSPACSRGSSIHSTEKQLFKLLFADFSLLIIIAMCRFRRAKGSLCFADRGEWDVILLEPKRNEGSWSKFKKASKWSE